MARRTRSSIVAMDAAITSSSSSSSLTVDAPLSAPTAVNKPRVVVVDADTSHHPPAKGPTTTAPQRRQSSLSQLRQTTTPQRRQSSMSQLQNDDDDDDEDPSTSSSSSRPSWFVIQVTLIASLGGILFGYDLGVISGALPQLIQTFSLTNSQKEAIVSVLYIGGGMGASLGGSLCDVFGRKRAILYTDLCFLLGAGLLYAAPNIATLLLGRIVVGFAVAVSGIADVSYLHEIAPVQFRGAVVSVNEACISLGFLLAFGVGSILEQYAQGWRYMFGLSGVLALIQLIGMWNMPESPKWLSEKGRTEESEEAMRRIDPRSLSSSSWIEMEPDGLRRSASEVLENRSSSGTNTFNYYQATATSQPPTASNNNSDEAVEAPFAALGSPDVASSSYPLLYTPSRLCRQFTYLCQQLRVFVSKVFTHHRKQAFIAIFLAVAQQLSGQTNVLSYAPLIFAAANNKQEPSSSTTLLIGVVKFIVTVLVIWKIERLGRRLLLLSGMGIVCLGLFLLCVAFAKPTEEGAPNYAILALPGVLFVVCGYSMSFGPLTWLLTSELFPTDIQGRALGASTIVTYLMASFVTYTFLSAQELLGTSVVFALYLLATATGLLFSYLAIPDTGGKNDEEIESDLQLMYWWRENGPLSDDASPLFQKSLPGRIEKRIGTSDGHSLT